jgi:hypothetical protein
LCAHAADGCSAVAAYATDASDADHAIAGGPECWRFSWFVIIAASSD